MTRRAEQSATALRASIRRRRAAALVACVLVAALLGAACEEDAPGLAPPTPTPADGTPAPTPPDAPSPPPLPAPEEDEPVSEPGEIEFELADLAGEDPALIAFLLDELEPQCQQDREEFAHLTERTWRLLNEVEGIPLPVTGILSRILAELPPNGVRYNCESLLGAVVTERRS